MGDAVSPVLPAWFRPKAPDSDVVISTRVRLARNLHGHQFPPRASLMEKNSIFNEVSTAISSLAPFRNHTCVNFLGAPKLSQELLAEQRAVSPELLKLDGDRGVISDETSLLSVMINEEDHLRIQGLDAGYQPSEIWQRINTIDDQISEALNYAYDSRLGFMTSCPTNAGTGLRVSFLLHLPGLVLTKTIDQALVAASQTGLATRGFFGENSVVIGNLFQLSNQATMGASEQEFIDNTQKIIESIIECERAARRKILDNARVEITDKVWRSYGLLRYARTLTMEDLLNLSSAIRLGCETAIFGLVSLEDLCRLTMLCQPAHLQSFHGRAMTDEEIETCRAEMVRETLDASQ
jgi:protein arginine kinase